MNLTKKQEKNIIIFIKKYGNELIGILTPSNEPLKEDKALPVIIPIYISEYNMRCEESLRHALWNFLTIFLNDDTLAAGYASEWSNYPDTNNMIAALYTQKDLERFWFAMQKKFKSSWGKLFTIKCDAPYDEQ